MQLTDIDDKLDSITGFLNKLYGLPGIALVFLLCLLAGYAMRISKKFPNDAIPLVLIIMGAAILPLISDYRGSPLPMHIWLIRNVVVGSLIGLGTWIFHKVILKKLEDKLPFLKGLLEPPDDTVFVKKADVQAAVQDAVAAVEPVKTIDQTKGT